MQLNFDDTPSSTVPLDYRNMPLCRVEKEERFTVWLIIYNHRDKEYLVVRQVDWGFKQLLRLDGNRQVIERTHRWIPDPPVEVHDFMPVIPQDLWTFSPSKTANKLTTTTSVRTIIP